MVQNQKGKKKEVLKALQLWHEFFSYILLDISVPVCGTGKTKQKHSSVALFEGIWCLPLLMIAAYLE